MDKNTTKNTTKITEAEDSHWLACARYGIDPLSRIELEQCLVGGLDSDAAYELACDLYCGAFCSFDEGLGSYLEHRDTH